ncbi:MAG: glycogen/starch/alpha-glucan phosphorylase [Thermoanaerobaculia bacterium]|nr:glycogen/starch/alpha-glucan phosphorylase [Thermoanaerobaculia bacterium]
MKKIPKPNVEEITPRSVSQRFARSMIYELAKDEYTANEYDLFFAFALSVREPVVERWFATQRTYYREDVKRVYYLSLEFLTGRLLLSNIQNLGAQDAHLKALEDVGLELEELQSQESEPALGNGGLGRLAACFLESAATLQLPVYGYGIRYEYGIFRQHIVDGFQQEAPDNWLRRGNPWEIPRHDAIFPVRFFGNVRYQHDSENGERFIWENTEDVWAMAYDTPVIGYQSGTVNSLRLWAAKSSREFDLASFNAGEYVRAVEEKNESENISKVLYPVDDRYVGRELRLKQQYFFVSATLQDVVRRFVKRSGRIWEQLPEKVAVQLNDTHPAIAIPELMRILMDDHGLGWDRAWKITEKTFGYTNHTVLPEALEVWSTDLMGRLLPRHLQIIEEIDRRVRQLARQKTPGDEKTAERVAIVDYGLRHVRMANLAIVGSHSVNGVAELHTQILRDSIFPDFDRLFPGRFNAKTNGITPRRWLLKANPDLSALITDSIGDRWITDLDALREIETFIDDSSFREEWAGIKLKRKRELSDWLERRHGVNFDPAALLDVQVKRIHEYKRQLLNILHVIHLYREIVDGNEIGPPRTVLFGGKAAPSYITAKLIIKLANAVGTLIAKEPKCDGLLKVVYVPDYRVTAAERIFPACELSEQISAAGTEASGTGNMKAALNGALTIGTLDGANVELMEELGRENMFIFGLTRNETRELRLHGYDPNTYIERSRYLQRVLETLETMELEPANIGLFRPLVDALRGHDRFFVCADFDAYLEAQRKAGDTWLDRETWVTMSIRNTARVGRFSSDRTIRQYAKEIWGVGPVEITGDGD